MTDLHNKQTQEMRKRFICDKCEYKTTSKTALEIHMESKHLQKQNKTPKRKICNICDKKFNKENTFNDHMRKYHKEGHY